MAKSNKKCTEMLDSLSNEEENPFIRIQQDRSFDLNSRDKFGKTMLSYAAMWGDLKFAEYLLEKGAHPNIRNSDGSKPLHIAAKFGRKDIVNLFLGRAMFVDSCDKFKCTPLRKILFCIERAII